MTSQQETNGPSYDNVQESADYLLGRTKLRPKIGIICGSGLGGLADLLTDRLDIPYNEIPHFVESTAPGHKGQLVFGFLGGKEVVCMQGRLHFYEGHSINKVVLPVRVMKLLGVKLLMVTCATGGLNMNYQVGDFVMIKDHINLPGLVGVNPLMGPNDERFGERFPAISKAYTREYRKTGQRVAQSLGYDEFTREGVYIMQTGPCYETVAECKLFRMMGADIAGMSTVPEVITAVHLGMDVFATAIVTNMVEDEYETKDGQVDSDTVVMVAQHRAPMLAKFIATMVKEVDL